MTEKAKGFPVRSTTLPPVLCLYPGRFFFSQNQPHEAEAEAPSPGGQVAPLHEEKVYQTRGAEGLGEADQDEETQFQLLMDRLGAPKVLEE